MVGQRFPRTVLAVGLTGLIAALLPALPTVSAQPASGPWIEVNDNGWDPDTVTAFGWPDGMSVTVQVDHQNDGTFDQEATQPVAEAGTTFAFQRQEDAEDSEQQGSLPTGAFVRATGSDRERKRCVSITTRPATTKAGSTRPFRVSSGVRPGG